MTSQKPTPILAALMLILGAAFWVYVLAPRPVEAQKAALGTVADISGSGTAVQIATSGAARWVQISTCAAGTAGCTGNAAVVRVGDSNVSVSRGTVITPGGGQFLPPLLISSGGAPTDALYQLSTIYLYIASGDKASVTWGN